MTACFTRTETSHLSLFPDVLLSLFYSNDNLSLSYLNDNLLLSTILSFSCSSRCLLSHLFYLRLTDPPGAHSFTALLLVRVFLLPALLLALGIRARPPLISFFSYRCRCCIAARSCLLLLPLRGGGVSHRDLRPCVARTTLPSGTTACALSVETNSFVRGAFVEAGTFLPSFVGKVSRAHRDRTACVSLVVTVFVLIDR